MSSPRNLLIPAAPTSGGRGAAMDFEPSGMGFEYLKLQVRRIPVGEKLNGSTGLNELGIVGLGGTFDLESSQGSWKNVGTRANVFTGMPWAVYLPIHTDFAVTALTDCDIAFCYCRAEISHRGGVYAERQLVQLPAA